MAKSSKERYSVVILPLFSVFLGFVVWVINKHSETDIRTIQVDVVPINQPDYIDVQSYSPEQVLISFNIRKTDEILIRRSDEFKVEVDLSQFEDRAISSQSYEEIAFRVNQDNLLTPRNLNFVRYEDDPVIRFNAKMRVAQAKISPVFSEGSPAQGYEVDVSSIYIDPSEVTVAVDEATLLESQARQIEIFTEPINVSGKKDNMAGIFSLQYVNGSGIYPIPGRPKQSVTVELAIPEVEESKVYQNVPIRFSAIKRNIVAIIEPEAVDVTLTGPVSLLDQIDIEDIIVDPVPDRQLDAEIPGSFVEIALRVSLQTDIDTTEIESIKSESSAVIRFESIANPDPTPTPAPSPTPTPTPTPEPESVDEVISEITPLLEGQDQTTTETPSFEEADDTAGENSADTEVSTDDVNSSETVSENDEPSTNTD